MPGAEQRVRGHRRRRRLAVRAGDGDDALERASARAAARRGGWARAHALGVVGRDRGRDEDVGVGAARWPRRGRRARSRPSARSWSSAGDSARSEPADGRAELARRRAPSRSCRPRRCRRDGPCGPPRAARRPQPPAALRTSRAISRAASGRASRRDACGHRGQPAGVGEQRADLLGQPLGRQLVVGHDDRRAGVRHPARVGGLVVGGGVRVGHEDRRHAVRGDLEDRAAGAGDGQVGGGQRVAERRDVGRAGRSRRAAGSPSARAQRLVVALPGRRAGRGRARPRSAATAASLIDRAPSEPPKTSTQVSSSATPKRARAAARSVCGGGTGRPVTR